MPVRQIAPENERARKRFVALEQELFGNEPLFVPEIRSDVDKRLRGRSPFYEEMDHTPSTCAALPANDESRARRAAIARMS